MRELGERAAQSLKQQNVLERVGQVVLPTNHVTDLQLDIIDGRGQVVGGGTIAPEQGEVFNVADLAGLPTVNQVIECE